MIARRWFKQRKKANALVARWFRHSNFVLIYFHPDEWAEPPPQGTLEAADVRCRTKSLELTWLAMAADRFWRCQPLQDDFLHASLRMPAEAQEWVRGLGGDELSLRVEVTRNAGGMALDDGAELVASIGRALSRSGLDPRPRAKPTSTEAGVFARAGCQAVVIGPGCSTGNAHTPNERIEIAPR